MTKIMQSINQWQMWQRSVLLCVLLFIAWSMWYLCLEKPLLAKNNVAITQLTQTETVLKELNALLMSQNNFLYKNDVQPVALRQTFQTALSSASGLHIETFQDGSILSLPAGAGQFLHVQGVLTISLLNIVRESPATIVFSGKFPAFVIYLQTLKNNQQAIYFDSIDFDMNRYPVAKITMKAFTLGA